MSLTTEQQQIYVAIWAKAVDTQMHFNEMSVKSRQFGLAFVAAALGLAIVLWSRGEEFYLRISIAGGGFDLHATVLIILASAFALYAVRILDLNVYHKMLRGAVKFGEDFEQNYMKGIFDLNLGMTGAITHYSQFEDADVEIKDGKYSYTGRKKKTAKEKVELFYKTAIYPLIAMAVIVFIFTANFGHPAPPVVPTVSATRPAPAAPTKDPIKPATSNIQSATSKAAPVGSSKK